MCLDLFSGNEHKEHEMNKRTVKKKAANKRASPRRTTTRIQKRWHEAIIADYALLRQWPGVERVALGIKEVKGRLTGRNCVKIYVRNKGARLAHPSHKLPAKARVLLPVKRGIFKSRWLPTDVVNAGTVSLSAAASDFFNPILTGAEIGPSGGMERGTHACMVRDTASNLLCLTAGHVVSSSAGDVPPDLPVNQPLNPPPGIPQGDIFLGETVAGFVGNQPLIGFVDWATIRLQPPRTGVNTAWDPRLTFTRRVLSMKEVVNGHPSVEKLGGATQFTTGGFSARIPELTFTGGVARDVLEFKGDGPGPIAQKGDSGALVVSRSAGSAGAVVGILFAVQDPPEEPGGRAYVFPLERLQNLCIA
jgi:hypothetical protein